MELVEDEPDPAVPATREQRPPGRPRRRARWWVGGAAAVVVTSLALAQHVSDTREAARLQTLGAVRGVVAPVSDPLRVLWRSDSTDLPWTADWHDPRTLVGARVDDDGSVAVVSVDARTGQRLWSVPLVAALPAAAEGPRLHNAGTSCAAAPPAADGAQRHVVCLAVDTRESLSPARELTFVAPTTSRLVVLDASTGQVVADHDTETEPGVLARQFVLLDEVVVLSGVAADGSGDIWALDLYTGAERWRRNNPAAALDWAAIGATTDVPVSLWRLNGREAMVSVPGRVEVVDAQGRSEVFVQRGGSFGVHLASRRRSSPARRGRRPSCAPSVGSSRSRVSSCHP